MSIFESLVVALICMTIVFAVLAALYLMITVITKILASVKGRNTAENVSGNAANNPLSEMNAAAEQVAAAIDSVAGDLKLNNVEEKTAAMIMAIVSHESKIPLNELVFKSISAVE